MPTAYCLLPATYYILTATKSINLPHHLHSHLRPALFPNAPKKNCSLRHQKLSALGIAAPKKNCVCLPARQVKEFLGVKRLKTKSSESFLVVELFCLSGTQRNSSNYFSVHASFGSFLTLRKEHLKNLFWSLSRCISGLRKEQR
jgi:hypothetical protein